MYQYPYVAIPQTQNLGAPLSTLPWARKIARKFATGVAHTLPCYRGRGLSAKILTITYDISLYIIRIVELFQLFPSRKLVNVWARFPNIIVFTHVGNAFFINMFHENDQPRYPDGFGRHCDSKRKVMIIREYPHFQAEPFLYICVCVYVCV